MKTAKTTSHTQRRVLEEKLNSLKLLPNFRPRSGWLRALRESLGLTSRSLAARLEVSMASIIRMEEREIKGAITLESLDRTARAMGCRLVYAIVPEPQYSGLEAILDERALRLARKLAKSVNHSMQLENQGIDASNTESQIQQLAHELKIRLDPRLWEK